MGNWWVRSQSLLTPHLQQEVQVSLTKPPDEWPQEAESDEQKDEIERRTEDVREEEQEAEEILPLEEPRARDGVEDLSSSSTSMGRIALESRREMKREMKSFEFFDRRERERKRLKGQKDEPARPSAAEVPVPADEDLEFDPDRHDYHHAKPSRSLDPIAEGPEVEAQEREAKRLRIGEAEDASLQASDVPFAFMATEVPNFLKTRRRCTTGGTRKPFWQKALMRVFSCSA